MTEAPQQIPEGSNSSSQAGGNAQPSASVQPQTAGIPLSSAPQSPKLTVINKGLLDFFVHGAQAVVGFASGVFGEACISSSSVTVFGLTILGSAGFGAITEVLYASTEHNKKDGWVTAAAKDGALRMGATAFMGYAAAHILNLDFTTAANAATTTPPVVPTAPTPGPTPVVPVTTPIPPVADPGVVACAQPANGAAAACGYAPGGLGEDNLGNVFVMAPTASLSAPTSIIATVPGATDPSYIGTYGVGFLGKASNLLIYNATTDSNGGSTLSLVSNYLFTTVLNGFSNCASNCCNYANDCIKTIAISTNNGWDHSSWNDAWRNTLTYVKATPNDVIHIDIYNGAVDAYRRGGEVIQNTGRALYNNYHY
jgi:hypothetical protein